MKFALSLSKNPDHPSHYHDFLCLSLGRFCSMLGYQVLTVATGWHIYELTNDPLAIGLVGLAQFVPSLLLVLFAGQIADQHSRARIMVVTSSAMVLAALLLTGLTFFNSASAPAIYAVAILLGIARIFGSPAGQAILPSLVPPKVFSRAVAVNSMVFQIALISGPAVAGAAFFMGTTAVYALSACLLIVAGLLYASIRTHSKGEKRPLTPENLFAGLKFILSRPVMLGAISLDLFAVLFGGVVALLPVYAKDILHIGPQGLGLLRSAPGIGAVLMSFVLARISFSRNIGPILFGSVGVFGLATIVFGLSTLPYLSFASLMVLGAADMISVYVRTHLTQLSTPDDMRGRVSSVNMLFITTSNELGEFESGLAASLIGVVPSVIFGGVMAIMVAGLVAWRVPSLRRLDGWPEKEEAGRA